MECPKMFVFRRELHEYSYQRSINIKNKYFYHSCMRNNNINLFLFHNCLNLYYNYNRYIYPTMLHLTTAVVLLNKNFHRITTNERTTKQAKERTYRLCRMEQTKNECRPARRSTIKSSVTKQWIVCDFARDLREHRPIRTNVDRNLHNWKGESERRT